MQDQQLFETMIIWTALNMQLFTRASWKISVKLTVRHTMTLIVYIFIVSYKSNIAILLFIYEFSRHVRVAHAFSLVNLKVQWSFEPPVSTTFVGNGDR